MIIFLIILFAIFGVVAFFAIKKVQSLDPNNGINDGKDIETAQSFLPFSTVVDGVIDLGNHQYRAFLRCESINYNSRTDKEKEIIEASYQRFLNSLTHPISIFIQTKYIDNTLMLKEMEEDAMEVLEEFPELEDFMQNHLKNMSEVYETIGNDKEKIKYIIVPFDEANTLTNLSEAEKYEFAINKIYDRCQIISENLRSFGISSQILNTKELYEIVYTTFHKDCASQIDSILDGSFLSMLVDGEDRIAKTTDEGVLDWALYEAQMRIQTELLNDKSINDNLRSRGLCAIEEIEKMREAIAGEYKYVFNIQDKIKIYD